MATTTTNTTDTNPAEASATGYEAFIEDSGATSAHNIEANVYEDVVQSKITTHFPQKSTAGEKTSTDNVVASEEAPALTASSSSEESQTNEETKEETKGKLSDWADKFSSSCQMDTTCGKLELEFMKKEAAPAPQANALTEKGELPAIEDLPRPEPWTRQVSDATTETLNTVSTKASGLIQAMGLSAKKEQNPITDNHQSELTPAPEETEKEPKKSLSEKAQELQNSVTTNTLSLKASVMSTLGLAPEEKEMKQKLMTESEPNSTPKEQSELSDDDVLSVCTEQAPIEPAPTAAAAAETQLAQVAENDEKADKEEEVEKSSWKIWKQVKGFMRSGDDGLSVCTDQAPTEPAPTGAAAAAAGETQLAQVAENDEKADEDEKVEKSEEEADKEEEVEKSSVNIWVQVKGFMGKFRLPVKADIPNVEVPLCPIPEMNMEFSTPKIEIPSYTLFSCNPKVVPSTSNADCAMVVEETKTDDTKVEEETKPKKVEDAKAEQIEPETPKSLVTPW